MSWIGNSGFSQLYGVRSDLGNRLFQLLSLIPPKCWEE